MRRVLATELGPRGLDDPSDLRGLRGGHHGHDAIAALFDAASSRHVTTSADSVQPSRIDLGGEMPLSDDDDKALRYWLDGDDELGVDGEALAREAYAEGLIEATPPSEEHPRGYRLVEEE